MNSDDTKTEPLIFTITKSIKYWSDFFGLPKIACSDTISLQQYKQLVQSCFSIQDVKKCPVTIWHQYLFDVTLPFYLWAAGIGLYITDDSFFSKEPIRFGWCGVVLSKCAKKVQAGQQSPIYVTDLSVFVNNPLFYHTFLKLVLPVDTWCSLLNVRYELSIHLPQSLNFVDFWKTISNYCPYVVKTYNSKELPPLLYETHPREICKQIARNPINYRCTPKQWSNILGYAVPSNVFKNVYPHQLVTINEYLITLSSFDCDSFLTDKHHFVFKLKQLVDVLESGDETQLYQQCKEVYNLFTNNMNTLAKSSEHKHNKKTDDEEDEYEIVEKEFKMTHVQHCQQNTDSFVYSSNQDFRKLPLGIEVKMSKEQQYWKHMFIKYPDMLDGQENIILSVHENKEKEISQLSLRVGERCVNVFSFPSFIQYMSVKIPVRIWNESKLAMKVFFSKNSNIPIDIQFFNSNPSPALIKHKDLQIDENMFQNEQFLASVFKKPELQALIHSEAPFSLINSQIFGLFLDCLDGYFPKFTLEEVSSRQKTQLDYAQHNLSRTFYLVLEPHITSFGTISERFDIVLYNFAKGEALRMRHDASVKRFLMNPSKKRKSNNNDPNESPLKIQK